MFDAKALFASSSTLPQVPLFLAALFAMRALPALLYRLQLGMRRTMAERVIAGCAELSVQRSALRGRETPARTGGSWSAPSAGDHIVHDCPNSHTGHIAGVTTLLRVLPLPSAGNRV